MYVPTERLISHRNFDQACQWLLNQQDNERGVADKIHRLHDVLNGYQWEMKRDSEAFKKFRYHPLYSEDHEKGLLDKMLNTSTTCEYPYYEDPGVIIPAWLSKNSAVPPALPARRVIDILNGSDTLPSACVLNQFGHKQQGIIDTYTFEQKGETLPAFFRKNYIQGNMVHGGPDFINQIVEPNPKRPSPISPEPNQYVGVIEEVWERAYDLVHALHETPYISQQLRFAEQRLNEVIEHSPSREAAHAKAILQYMRKLIDERKRSNMPPFVSSVGYADSESNMFVYDVHGFTNNNYKGFTGVLADVPITSERAYMRGAKQLSFSAGDPLAKEAKDLYLDIYSECNRVSQTPNPAFVDEVRAFVHENISFIVEPSMNAPQAFNFWWRAWKKPEV